MKPVTIDILKPVSIYIVKPKAFDYEICNYKHKGGILEQSMLYCREIFQDSFKTYTSRFYGVYVISKSAN